MNGEIKHNILVVDDQQINIMALTRILSPEYTVYTANNGPAAIQTAEEKMPDIVLLDIVMPDMDGYAVITELKKSEKTRDIPVIFLTALTRAGDEDKGLSLGAADYIAKPFSPEIVKLRIKNQLMLSSRLRSVEYDLMNFKLASAAMRIALWSMDVIVNDPVNMNNKFIWSPEFRYMLGFSDENDFPNVLRSWYDCLHPEDRERSVKAFAAHMNDYTGKTPYEIEYRLKRKNGEYRYFDGFGSTLRDSKGVPIRVSGYIRDITEKKLVEIELEKALLESNRTLDIMTSVLNKSDAMIYVTDLDTDEILFMTDSMKRHFGIERDIIGQPCYKVLNKGIDSRCDWCPCHKLDEAPDNAVVWEEHNTLNRKYYLNTDRYVDWPGGKKVHIQYRVDLTDIKKAQEALENREALLDALNKTAIELLSQNSDAFEDIMSSGIRQIADLFEIDRFSLFRNFNMPDGMHASQIYRWDRASGGTTKPTEFYADVTYARFAPNWEHILGNGNVINGPGRLMPDQEAATLLAAGVVSTFVVPVFIDGAFWGFVLYEDRFNERYFDDSSAEIMRASAYLFANAVVRDEMEREITKANNRTKILLDKTPLCCQLWDSNYKKIDCNEAAVKLFGFKDKQDYLERYPELYYEYQPDGQRTEEKAMASVKKAFEEGSYTLDWTYKMLDGTSMPTEIIMVRVEYEDGYGVAGYTRDLREYKKMMDEINHRDSLLRAVNSTASVLLTKESNETFRDTLLRGMEIIGQSVDVDCIEIWRNEIIDGELHAVIKQYWFGDTAAHLEPAAVIQSFPYSDTADWESRLSRGECIQGSLETLSPEDRAFVEPFGVKSLLVIPVFMENRLWGICCIDDYSKYRDFSEDEINILRSCGLLFVNALLRNDMLQDIRDTSVRLEAALEQAEAASKAKGDFLSAMSHEMRTPMNAIIGMTAIGNKTKDIEEKNHALSKIGDASSHLLGVINDVLDMAKIEANKLELVPVEYNFEKMLQKVTTVINFRINEKRQRFSVEIDSNIPAFLVGDDQRLAQVITYLLSNAVKFTPEGGKIQLTASLTGETAEGDCDLRIEVADSGIGIAPEQHEKLFGMFEQAETGISREYGGTGLGLVISKRIVELMGGEIWLESELGKGAKFIFTAKAKCGTRNPKSMLSSGVNWKNVKVLVVDDMADILSHFQRTLGQFDIQCDVAADGVEALRVIEERGEYDIYFIDWRMPGMDGIELTRRIKSQFNGRTSVVIMITAMDWNQIKDEAIGAGVVKCLLKPLLPSTIIDAVNDCLGISDAEEGSASYTNEFSGKTLLIAEDIEINREILTALLSDTGLAIDCVENGIEALEMIESAPDKYDIVFMDVQMPKMDGLEATRRIRALSAPRASKLPIIAMTANVFRDDIEACIDAGMDDHLGKPLDIDKVYEKLRKYLS